MLKNESMVIVADNTWAKKAQIIRILKWSMATTANVWDFVVVAIKSVTPNSHVKKWQIIYLLLIFTL